MTGPELIALLPHRPPLLLLEDARPQGDRRLVAYQTIAADNPLLAGHFPGFPVWPGALLIEAMAQTTAVFLLASRAVLRPGELPVLGAVECRFLKPVFAGQTIEYRAELVRRIADLGLFAVTAVRGGEVVARGKISAGLTAASKLAPGR